ncbi:MAG: bifunctional methylenetetrahydrofolate dehydrogenase/methenyltetrahydrofolate cyclohydrolase FolD [Anaerolineae bacterium CG_4_9_14_3_um_filter_57_17]|nr:bifunctional methylenetetrahydrofolate dehydrogenase/methenyltetrahydrofolate cyclohydrolase FolD [bacterium]NCT21182.1 bifunctional methylenetetrahydrofolate dehydrogenase/methenyltetrahydrofolate cyclohydrolase FolD [bacterium]OIO86824.1 MAG: bifunctional methylenetetrahydrofolate dehydrogenase/methenyltetrahydrofolate cyclohydrolase [Anaerolineae bacterium CG2_30_57_67]PJB65633.1 MAG: bifunctional methylenetetrahydrofolate dehydrogenase/methenyltetrahydrofolate cyclohydrolase FolD [Anaerol
MTAQLIDGKEIAQQVRQTVAAEVAARAAQGKARPGLATVLVGDRPDSAAYVAAKQKACQELGMVSYHRPLPADISQEALEAEIRALNADPAVNGILVQLPLPAHLNEERVLALVSIEKDVDGFSPLNIGRLAQKGREPLFVPCTPYGCIYLLEQAGVKIEGANAIVLGRSNIVGMPAALLLIGKNATVTVCHSRTKNLPQVVRQADILIAAIGKAEMVRGNWIKPGAAVIDVGINAIPDSTKKSGHRLVGDVCFEEAREVAGFLTPVPGGVGPMTIAMLMKNTLRAAQIQQG